MLDGPSSGPGFRHAFVEPDSGRLFAELNPGDRDRVEIPYKVTDGTQYSERARVIVTIEATPSGGTRRSCAGPINDYATIEIESFATSRLPPSVDLSGNFPAPGSQGLQGSCVGWATAYALKSYQERIEEGWAFSPRTRFSPAWVYNQIKEPGPCPDVNPTDPYDCGSHIDKALELIVEKGAATEVHHEVRFDGLPHPAQQRGGAGSCAVQGEEHEGVCARSNS